MPNKTITGLLTKAGGKYSIVASTGDVDRDGEIIKPSAFKNLKAYLNTNPVILGFHKYDEFPIGKATAGRITDTALNLDIEFADTERGREARYLYDEGFMSSFSVGFIPKEWNHDDEGRRIYTDVELLEVSAVPVPSNAAANIIRQAKGIRLPELERIVREENTDDDEPTTEQVSDVRKSRGEKIRIRIQGVKHG